MIADLVVAAIGFIVAVWLARQDLWVGAVGCTVIGLALVAAAVVAS